MIGGGVKKVHNHPSTLSKVIRTACEKANTTIEQLAEKVGITERYLYRIENEGKKPSYDVLYNLIRALNISPDLIFYPEKESLNVEVENLIRMLYICDDRALEVITATARGPLGYLIK